MGIREVTPVGIWVGDARDISRCRRPLRPSWQRLGRDLYFDIDLNSCLGQRLITAKSPRLCLCHPRGAPCIAWSSTLGLLRSTYVRTTALGNFGLRYFLTVPAFLHGVSNTSVPFVQVRK